MNGQSDPDGDFSELVDAYCSGLIDDDGVRRLEAILLADAQRRRDFTRYFHHHTEIQFAVRAGHATDAALDRLSRFAGGRSRPTRMARFWLPRPGPSRSRASPWELPWRSLPSPDCDSLAFSGRLGRAGP